MLIRCALINSRSRDTVGVACMLSFRVQSVKGLGVSVHLTLSRATALFGTTRDLIEWVRALFGTISIWPTLSSHSSRSLRLSLKATYNRHRLVLFYICTKL